MGRFLLIILLVASAVGCNRARKELVGAWEFDAATYELIPKYRALSPDEQKHWVETAQVDVTITETDMRWDQRLPGWGDRTAEGPYRVSDSQGSRVNVVWSPDGKDEKIVFTVDGDRLRFSLRGRSIILRRVTPSGR